MTTPLPLTISGAPISTNGDPNSSAPSAARVWAVPLHVDAAADVQAVQFELVDGTSATIQLYLKTATGEWAAAGSAISLSATKTLSQPAGAFAGGVEVFARVTAVAGSPTTIRAGFVRTLPATSDAVETVTISSSDASVALLKQPTRSASVTPSDSTDITATATKGLWVGTAGDLSVKFAGDSSATLLKNVPSGTYVPGAFARVMAATTASNIVSLYGP